MEHTSVFFGERDLEMQVISRLLSTSADATLHDLGLAWGAKASVYEADIRAALAAGHRIVLVELSDDLPADIAREQIQLIDHVIPSRLAAGRHGFVDR